MDSQKIQEMLPCLLSKPRPTEATEEDAEAVADAEHEYDEHQCKKQRQRRHQTLPLR